MWATIIPTAAIKDSFQDIKLSIPKANRHMEAKDLEIKVTPVHLVRIPRSPVHFKMVRPKLSLEFHQTATDLLPLVLNRILQTIRATISIALTNGVRIGGQITLPDTNSRIIITHNTIGRQNILVSASVDNIQTRHTSKGRPKL